MKMYGLRTITMLEHEVIPVVEGDNVPSLSPSTDPWLSETEAEALLRLNDQYRGFCQRVSGGVKLAQHCGIVRLPTCVVEVLPKLGMADSRTPDELGRSRSALLAMLQSAQEMRITEVGPVPQTVVHAPLLDIFIKAFLHCALAQARRGLLSRYVAYSDDLPVIKGRFQPHSHIRHNLVRPHLLRCEYDEFTADNIYNRAVRATLEVCRTWINRASTERLWFETHARYASISAVTMAADDVMRLSRDRTTHRYATLLRWCEWLLAIASPALSTGASQAPGLLFDMNKLFEAHAARFEEAKAGLHRIVQRQGPPQHLAFRGPSGVFLLKPDITVWHIGDDGTACKIDRVVDAKWKRLNPAAANFGVDIADVYQLLAYAWRYDCSSVELAYPLLDIQPPIDSPLLFDLALSQQGSARAITIRLTLVPVWSVRAMH